MNNKSVILHNILFLTMSIITTLCVTMQHPICISEEWVNANEILDKLFYFLPAFCLLVKTTSVASLFIAIFFFLFYLKIFGDKHYHFSLAPFTLSVLFSVFILMGISYSQSDSWDIMFYVPVAFIVLLGSIPPIYAALLCIFKLPARISDQGASSLQPKNHLISFILYKHSFSAPFLIICFLWLPWLIAFCPGTLFPDGLGQLNCFFRVTPWNDHHPAFSTMIMGSCMFIGRILGSDNYGIFIYVIMQYLTCAAVFSESIRQMGNLKVPDAYRIAALIFYSLFSVWPSYAICFIKDTLFFAVVLLYILLYTKAVLSKKIETKNVIYLTVIGLLVCLLRKNGLYFIISTIPVLFWIHRKDKTVKYYLASGLLIFLCIYSFQTFVFTQLHILKGGTQEALSIPFQQTARYVRDYPEDVSEAEKEAINGVLNYDALAELYVPEISDPVKGTYHWGYETAVENPGEKEALKKYFHAWIQGLFKHPTCYVQATLNNIYGYFYPDETSGDSQAGYYLITHDPVVDHGFFNVEFANNLSGVRKTFENIAESSRRLPGIGLLYSAGTWIWMLIVLSVYHISKHNWKLFYITVPFLVLILVCCASPVNGYLRYVLPLMASMPWLCALFIKSEDFC